MFDVGFSEILMVGLVGLLVMGPERLPKVAREVALWLRKARTLVNNAKADIKRELDLEELKELCALQESMQLQHINPLSVLEEAVAQPEAAEIQHQPKPAPAGKSHV